MAEEENQVMDRLPDKKRNYFIFSPILMILFKNNFIEILDQNASGTASKTQIFQLYCEWNKLIFMST